MADRSGSSGGARAISTVPGPLVGLALAGAPGRRARPARDELLLAHQAPHDLLRDPDAAAPQLGVHAAAAVAAAARLEGRPHLGPQRGVAVASEPGAVVLIGAPRYPQETDDRAEGQAGRQPQSLPELALAPVRDRTRLPAYRF